MNNEVKNEKENSRRHGHSLAFPSQRKPAREECGGISYEWRADCFCCCPGKYTRLLSQTGWSHLVRRQYLFHVTRCCSRDRLEDGARFEPGSRVGHLLRTGRTVRRHRLCQSRRKLLWIFLRSERKRSTRKTPGTPRPSA